jgi:hypothetical protein
MKVATFLLENRKLSPNEAISADKRAVLEGSACLH